MRLDLACGTQPQPGYEGVDRYPGPHVDHVQNLFADRWKWASESVEAVWCSHFVEHVPNLGQFMNEVWRILVPGGIATIVHPYQFSLRAWQDPTHVRALNEVSWQYYNADARVAMGVDHYLDISADFEIVDVQFILSPEWQKAVIDNGWTMESQELLYAIRHSVNVVDDLYVVLRKL